MRQIPIIDQADGGLPVPLHQVTVCPGCDLILATAPVPVPQGCRLQCPRCHTRVRTPKKDTVSRTLALSLTGLLLFYPAHYMLLLTFDVLGMQDHGSVFDSFRVLVRQQYSLVAVTVILTAQIFPLLKLGLLFLLSLGTAGKIMVRRLPALLRWYQHLEEWGMSEVYLIGILVTVIKMGHTARISYEIGFACFAGLALIMVSTALAFDRDFFWDRLETLGNGTQVPLPDQPLPPGVAAGRSARAAGLLQCHTCRKVMIAPASGDGRTPHCPRCGGLVHARVPHTVSATWALVFTAIILSVPANLLPIMEVNFLGVPDRSTILDGITYFFQEGSYGIGLIILTASILVPLFKILGLMVLLYSIHLRRLTRLPHKSAMFRFIEFIGRWSMLDVFVIALLCALVDFGFFTTIRTAPAATYFAGVVFATMFAAITFDPRLLWDVAEEEA